MNELEEKSESDWKELDGLKLLNVLILTGKKELWGFCLSVLFFVFCLNLRDMKNKKWK